MKWEWTTDPRTHSSRFCVFIDDFDYLTIEPLDDFDRALREDCLRSESLADKVLWLERFARLLEQAHASRQKPEVAV